jgi:hypothetical protein
MTDPMYCEHNRTRAACEDCLYREAVEAARPVAPVEPAATREATQRAVDELDEQRRQHDAAQARLSAHPGGPSSAEPAQAGSRRRT